MDGPVLSGGAIVLVAALLWMLYFLPSWRGRHQYYAAERNAVRLNQALRVLAETSETPEEVRLELNARTALAQQKLAKRAQAEREAAELERLRSELAAARADPVVRQARARRQTRLIATVFVVAGLVLLGLGVWQVVAGGAAILLVAGAIPVVSGVWVLQRMARVASRAARTAVVVADAPAVRRESPPLHDQGKASWTPRALPEPLVSVAGTRAHAERARLDAQEAERRAEREAELQRRTERLAPPAPVALPVREEKPATDSPYTRMGFVDDAEIEAHVRKLLAARAAS